MSRCAPATEAALSMLRHGIPVEERAALLAVLDAQGGLAAAAAVLGLHRNTVLQRVRRAETRRGRPANERLLELHAALRLAETLGPAVLTQP